jgi:glycosyltransferase involved in cell wall biosynthesis
MKAMRPPVVSVVIPAFNRAGTIGAAVDSVLAQTFQDLELILVDDASTDDTADVLAGLGDSRIRVIRHESNKGAGAARNTGIEAARGEWVAFQDSDDLWMPTKLERQMARLSSPGASYIAAYCGMLVEDMDNPCAQPRYIPDTKVTTREGNILNELLTRSFISTQTLVARRDLLMSIGGFDEELPALEDWECVLRLAQHDSFALVDEPLVRQRFSPNSITRSADRRLKARIQILEKHRELLARDPLVLASHHYSIAGALRQSGRLEEAAQHITAALHCRPFHPTYWGMRVYLAALRLLAQLRSQAVR